MRLFLAFALILYPFVAGAQVTPTAPIEPTAAENTVAVPLSIKTVVTDAAGLTSALAAAACGDLIPIDHTVTINDGGTPFTLPAVVASCVGSAVGASAVTGSSGARAVSGSSGAAATAATGDNYITIASDSYASLPASGTRVTTANASLMPTLIAGNDSNGFFKAAIGTHHIRFLGLNITSKATAGGSSCSTMGSCGLLMLQSADTSGTDVHHIIIDRSLVKAHATTGARVGIQFSGADLTVKDGIIANLFNDGGTSENQGIALNGSGPFLIDNNEIGPVSSENFMMGDSILSYAGVNPCDLTFTHNYVHKIGLPAGAKSQSKNLQEAKQQCRAKYDGNVYDTAWAQAQQICIQFMSMRGSQGLGTDLQFTNNWVKNCPNAIAMTIRPSDSNTISTIAGDGTTNCSGGPCVKITLAQQWNGSDTGDLIELTGIGGTTEANGVWQPVTKVDSTHITIPVAFVHAYTSGGTLNIWYRGTPLSRVKISNNLWTNIGGVSDNAAARQFLTINTSTVLVPTAPGSDLAMSATGSWGADDIEVTHNTMIDGSGTAILNNVLHILQSGLTSGYTNYPGDRWLIRDNIFRLSSGGGGSLYSAHYAKVTGYWSTGSSALDELVDSATRDVSHNIGYQADHANEASTYTGNDTWITLSTTGCSVVVFTNCTADTVAGAALGGLSPGKGTASDATDVGVDTTALAAAIAGVEN